MSYLVGEFGKNSREVIKAHLTEFNGLKLVDFRVWANTPLHDEVRTRKGLSIQIQQIDEFLALVEQAKKIIGQGIGKAGSLGDGKEKGEPNALS